MKVFSNVSANNSKTVICIGNGDGNADSISALLSNKLKMTYHGILDRDTFKQDGVYHTSIYDIKPEELKPKLDATDTIVVLDISQSDFPTEDDYFKTLELAESSPNVVCINESIRNPFRKILSENKSICALPFISVYQKDNAISGCCFMLPSPTNAPIDIPHIREQMIKGEPIIGHCDVCYRIEDIGASSPRQTNTIEWANKLNIKSIDALASASPVYYDIRLNNECNAMCRTCEPASSNLIDKEYFKLQLVDDSIGTTSNPSYDSVDLENLQRLYVAGGEPTINSYFVNFLSKCMDKGKTDFEMIVNTNAAAISEKFAALISNFPNTKFEISIDAYGELNHYIRYPISWKKFTQNIDLLNSISDGKISFNSVISIYNGGKLFPLYEFLENNYPTATNHISILANPVNQRIDNFPNKEVALADLRKVQTLSHYQKYPQFRDGIDGIIKVIETSIIDETALAEFFEFNDKLDKSRNMSLEDYNAALHESRIK